jgi:hypothetical protein
MERPAETLLKIQRFADQMVIELEHNAHKGSVLDWHDFDNIMTELEYHKAKIFVAIRCKNWSALKEYIADTANHLLTVGNHFGLYEANTIDTGMVHELQRESIIVIKPVKDQQINQQLVDE